MTSKRDLTPRERIAQLTFPRVLHLFTESEELAIMVEAGVGQEKNTSVRIRQRLEQDAFAADARTHLYLVHLDPLLHWPAAVVEQLCQQDQRNARRILLILENAPSPALQAWIKQYEIHGYIMQDGVLDQLSKRIELMTKTGCQRRQSERFAVHFPVAFSYLGQRQRGVCTSWSTGGAFISTQHAPPSLVMAYISFKEPRSQKLYSLSSHVVYRTDAGFGARFQKETPHITKAITQNLRMPSH